MAKLKRDVDAGLSVVVFADWYNVSVMKKASLDGLVELVDFLIGLSRFRFPTIPNRFKITIFGQRIVKRIDSLL